MNTISSAIAHFISSVLSRANYIRYTKQTPPHPHQSSRVFKFFFLFSFSAFIFRNIPHRVCARIATRRYFFNQEYREYTNFSSGIAHFCRVAFPCFFFFLMTMNFYYILNFRDKSEKEKYDDKIYF